MPKNKGKVSLNIFLAFSLRSRLEWDEKERQDQKKEGICYGRVFSIFALEKQKKQQYSFLSLGDSRHRRKAICSEGFSLRGSGYIIYIHT